MLGQHDVFAQEGALEHGVTQGTGGKSRLLTALLIAAISASALSMIFSIGTAVLSARASNDAGGATQRAIGLDTQSQHHTHAVAWATTDASIAMVG